MTDSRCFAVNRMARRADVGAHHSRYDLHSQTDSQDRHAAGECLHNLWANAGLIRSEGARGDHDAVRRKCFHFGQSDTVRAVDHTTPTSGFQSLHQIPGKGIVVVENQDLQCEAVRQPLAYSSRATLEYGTGLTMARISACLWRSTVVFFDPPSSSPQ